MALVTCPECGRNNVSDSAEQCPECGYSIKMYFDAKREEEQKIILQKQLKLKEKTEWDKLLPELKEKLIEIKSQKIPDKPKKPNVINYFFKGNGQLFIWITVFLFVVGCLLIWLEWGFLIELYCAMLLVGMPCLIGLAIHEYNSELNWHKESVKRWTDKKDNWNEYITNEQEKLIQEYKKYAHNMAMYGTRKHEYYIQTPKQPETTLKCPVCGSLNIKKISTANRYISVHTVGLASSKIGKQYECKSCHHKW